MAASFLRNSLTR